MSKTSGKAPGTIIEALQAYLDACPLLKGRRLRVDYLPAGPPEYMISPTPGDEILRRYCRGAAHKQYLFVLASVHWYGEDDLTNLENSGFYEKLAGWMRQKTRQRALPRLPAGCTAQSLEPVSTGYLYNATATEARYQIQCRLVYHQKGD